MYTLVRPAVDLVTGTNYALVMLLGKELNASG